MKFRYAAYGLLALATVFAAVAGYLFYFQGGHESRALEQAQETHSRHSKAGRIVIAYAGDLMGNLDPCG